MCFNPCFLGTCPRSYCYARDIATRFMRFNPCFLGTCPRRRLVNVLLLIVIRFQSLFSWNLPSKLVSWHAHPAVVDVFQSLFSWNLPSKRWGEFVDSLIESLRFNPCFLGTCPRSLYHTGAFTKFHKVSILVFLELALEEHYLRNALIHSVLVSILVFLELALEVRIIAMGAFC